MGARGRSVNWDDRRDRSPKALNDMSGVVLSRVTASTTTAIQEFDYDLLSKFYVCHNMVWTCINLVSATVALGKLRVRQRVDNKYYELPDHPLQAVLDFPNGSMTQFDWIQSYVCHQMLFGNINNILLRPEMSNVPCPLCSEEGITDDCLHKLFIYNESPIIQMMPVHPSTLEIDYAPKSKQKFFYYVPEPGRHKYIIHPNNILSDPLYNPDVSWYGVSPTFLIKRWLDLDMTMTQQLTNYFKNGAIPSLIVNLKPSNNYAYDDEPSKVLEFMKEKWMERFAEGGSSNKAPAFVHGDVNVEKLQDQIEAAFSKNLYSEIQVQVCSTFGVPSSIFEPGNSSGSKSEEDEKAFFNRTISFYLTRIRDKINQLVVPSYNDPSIEVYWDLEEMGIANFLIKAKQEEIRKDWQLGLLKRNIALTALGYDPVDDEFGDDYYRITVMSDGSGLSSGTGSDIDKRLRVGGTQEKLPVNEREDK